MPIAPSSPSSGRRSLSATPPSPWGGKWPHASTCDASTGRTRASARSTSVRSCPFAPPASSGARDLPGASARRWPTISGCPCTSTRRPHSIPRGERCRCCDAASSRDSPIELRDPRFVPDFGPRLAHPTMGAAIVGARPFLIAWNLSLDTSDVDLARSIARRVRTSGQTTREGSELVRHPGLLPAVRAVGWGMPSYGHAQVSLNLLDFTVTPMHMAWRVVSEEAEAHGTRVIGSELVGLVPLEALRAAGRAARRRRTGHVGCRTRGRRGPVAAPGRARSRSIRSTASSNGRWASSQRTARRR